LFAARLVFYVLVVVTGRTRWWVVALCGVVAAGLAGSRVGAETSLFPIPEIVVDPNEGTTLGALGVAVVADETKRIRRIIAPDVRYNDVFGVYPTFRYFDYPTPNQRFFFSAGKSTKIDEYLELNYGGFDLLQGRLDVDAQFVRDRDSRERFYGIGNDTPSSDESNYTGDVFRGQLLGKWHLPDDLLVAAGARVRRVRVHAGGVAGIPYPGDLFSPDEVRGIDGETIVAANTGLWYDTRDLPDAATEGSLVGANLEVVDTAIGSSVSYQRWSVEGRTFQALREDRRAILAARAFGEYLNGGARAPFYELNCVGGVNSLRGYGSHRFCDRHRIGTQIELRFNVYQREVFGVFANLETAPFLDVAKVFADSRDSPFRDQHTVPGLAFRAVVRPQVVAYVDLGFANGGVAAFTGIDYPF
jgi:outer membrane protein assembly factor BamA